MMHTATAIAMHATPTCNPCRTRRLEPGSWRSAPALQQPTYPDAEALAGAAANCAACRRW